ncbi:Methyltransferase domain-containing protein [Blastococcus aggregatus]|uniref:Methyltransferase domain-containing protein n=1 Tax=Blastococcus aggregatus TaxID=38502 RepID=A0A285V876_9ACTN|nr:class I SAM-dependent methyltransferase [Blastococcus aggregatus]SOC49758.1 Methyltransferase domain-containing protein [Blastococcus aggregatus]
MSRSATLSRSVTLFRAFLHEQDDPDGFYSVLAADSVAQLRRWTDLSGATVLDVGGGAGYFADAFRAAGATYVGLEPDAGEMTARGEAEPGTLRGSGEELPIRSGVLDVCYSSNVLEHVRRPLTMADEMVRVTKPGGIIYLSFTPWLSPWGGHETAPWHYLGGHRARRRYQRRNGVEPKNKFGESLFAASAGSVARWANACPDADLLAVLPRYHPWWATWVARVPGLREFASWNFVVVLRRKA